MNGRERYVSVLEGIPVDSLPRVPILKQFAAGLVDQVLISDRFHSREHVYGTAGR